MLFFNLIKEPTIIIITLFFTFFLLFIFKNYNYVRYNLSNILDKLSSIKKSELVYRFKELDEFMISNPYTTSTWIDFKNVLVFSDKIYTLVNNEDLTKEFKPEIYLTVDASYFFNIESLVLTKINNNFIQSIPTILTGLGPFFTFFKMAIAFAGINFNINNDFTSSIGTLMNNIQLAALCSVFAVGYSLFFIFIEKLLFNKMCKCYQIAIQKEFVRLFDVVTGERFLIDLIRETKNQNITSEKILNSIPKEFALALANELKTSTTPYLENILYHISKLNENLKNGGNNSDVIDKLF